MSHQSSTTNNINIEQNPPSLSQHSSSTSSFSSNCSPTSTSSLSSPKPKTATPTNNDNASTGGSRKRSRATAEQLAVLEDTFATNVSPNSKLRKQLAEQLKMTERSIQIWFQNRRAKVKHMQKKAQMQMHQAALRAQMYHHQQQQYFNMYPSANALYWQQQQQQQCDTVRAATVDPSVFGGWSTPEQMPAAAIMANNRASMPPQPVATSNDLSISSLVPVPEAGPTALLAASTATAPPAPPTNSSSSPAQVSSCGSSSGSSDATTPPPLNLGEFYVDPLLLPLFSTTTVPEDMNNATASCTSTTMNNIADVGASTPPALPPPLQEIIISATTLSIGSWQRVVMNADLVCAYDPAQKAFGWHIINNGLHFKIFIPLGTVSAISYMEQDPALATIRFDLNETPQCFMKENDAWKPCGDFSEGKQVSRYFSHCIKGVAYQLKQDLFMLTTLCEETQKLIFPSHSLSSTSSAIAAVTPAMDLVCSSLPTTMNSLDVVAWM